MKPRTPLGERIAAVIDRFEGGRMLSFCEKTNTSHTYLSKLTREGNPNIRIFTKLMHFYPEVNGDWLLTGRGEMTMRPAEAAEAKLSKLREEYNALLDVIAKLEGNIAQLESDKVLLNEKIEKLQRNIEATKKKIVQAATEMAEAA